MNCKEKMTVLTTSFPPFVLKDSVADTFYSIGLVMRICQSLSILELLHIFLGIEKDHFFPRLLQVCSIKGLVSRTSVRFVFVIT